AGEPRQGYLAHAALLDLRKGAFYTGKRVSSEALGLAGSARGIMRVWNRDWKAETFGARDVLEFNLDDEKVRLRLIATYTGQPVLHGERGFSRKGQCQSCASQYFSLPGMQVEGQVEIDSRIEPVQGVAWMDHEFMSNALEESQSGWDWFSLQFKDGRKLMLYQLRARAGGISYASGTLISGAGTRALRPEEFSVEVLSTWASRKSGATYPARWRVRLPSAGIDETIIALHAEQEILGDDTSGITYWEGAVRTESREALGYVEMTGYQSELGAKF
ncbi:MAG: carotenoid 1,2-hydratase, partial [Deltaproteobacteria bacterium]|nr:carotenoid 1,2-hydratase [Deltaproteobacteria bacterium]